MRGELGVAAKTCCDKTDSTCMFTQGLSSLTRAMRTGSKKMAPKSQEALLDAFFDKSVRRGQVPDLQALKKFAASKGLGIPHRKLREWRRRSRAAAVFERIKSRPPGYVTNQHPKYGQVMMDLAFYKEKWRRFNAGAKGEEKKPVALVLQ